MEIRHPVADPHSLVSVAFPAHGLSQSVSASFPFTVDVHPDPSPPAFVYLIVLPHAQYDL
jgi:hypothetical protein